MPSGPQFACSSITWRLQCAGQKQKLSTLAIRSSHERGAPELGLPNVTPGAVHGLGFNFSLCDVQRVLV